MINDIQLDQLMGNTYDVDHIIPQSMTKDDTEIFYCFNKNLSVVRFNVLIL